MTQQVDEIKMMTHHRLGAAQLPALYMLPGPHLVLTPGLDSAAALPGLLLSCHDPWLPLTLALPGSLILAPDRPVIPTHANISLAHRPCSEIQKFSF